MTGARVLRALRTAALACVVPLVAAGGLYAWSESHQVLPGLGGCGYVRSPDAQARCYDRQVSSLVDDRGLADALDEIDAQAGDDAGLRARCHTALHPVGERDGAKSDGGSGKTGLDTSSNCRTGYAHGVLIARLASASRSGGSGPAALAKVPVDTCFTDPPDETFTSNCMHAMGHAYARTDDVDTADMTRGCHRLAPRVTRAGYGNAMIDTCMWGGFMERAFRSSTGDELPAPRDESRDCRGLDTSDQELCALFVPIRVGIHGGDPLDAARACSAATQEPVRLACARSYGRHIDSAGECANLDDDELRATCRTSVSESEDEAAVSRDTAPQR